MQNAFLDPDPCLQTQYHCYRYGSHLDDIKKKNTQKFINSVVQFFIISLQDSNTKVSKETNQLLERARH